MKIERWLCLAEAKRYKKIRKAAKPLTGKEIEKLIRSGKLTKEQAIELRKRYMDSLE